MTDVQITHRPDETRFVAEVDGAPAGFAEYQLTDDLYVFTHTEVDRAHEGLGVGGALARAALDHVRARIETGQPFVSENHLALTGGSAGIALAHALPVAFAAAACVMLTAAAPAGLFRGVEALRQLADYTVQRVG